MKQVMCTLMIVILFSCQTNVSENYDSNNNRVNDDRQYQINQTIDELRDQIVLLAIIKDISVETVETVVREYEINSWKDVFPNPNEEESFDIKELIDQISLKVNLSKRDIASIIYAIIYEMRTPEQIADEINLESYYQEIEFEHQ